MDTPLVLKVSQDHAASEGAGEGPSCRVQRLVAPGVPLHVAASRRPLPCHRTALSVYVSYRTPVIALRAHVDGAG